jgi:hypothetical protein
MAHWHNYCLVLTSGSLLVKPKKWLLIPMKIIYFLLFLIIPHFSFGQSVVDQTVKAINDGNITEMAKSFDKLVDLTLINEQSTYSKSQATIVLKKFFSQNEIASFTVKHKGTPANNASMYIIGTLETKEKKDFRLYLFFKEKTGGLFLQEIRIDD